MKFLNVVLIFLLLAALAGAAYFYQFHFRELNLQAQLSKTNAAQLDLSKKQLKKYQDQESWMPAAAETLRTGLKEEIAAGKAEVAEAGSRLVVNIPEDVLYMQGSRTFSLTSGATLTKLASVLKTLKGLNDKEILVGNTAASAPARGTGRRKVPARDGRTLAAERSLELVKYLEKNGVSGELLASVAYAPGAAEHAFRIKGSRTIITIGLPAAAAVVSPAPVPAPSVPSAPQPKPGPAAPAPAGQPLPPQQSRPQPSAPQPIPIPVQPR